tara:strand:- start:1340 stop:1621 length:282 start_codon:yes stop_codon:yes gene_type:complete
MQDKEKYKHKDGSGSLFKNKYKDTETKPDYKGTCTDPSGKIWELAGWASKTNEGESYLSIKLQEVYVKPDESSPKRDGRNEAAPVTNDTGLPF